MRILQLIESIETFAGFNGVFSRALTNSALGMIIVFSILIVMSFLIYLMKYIPKHNDNTNNEIKKPQVSNQHELVEESISEELISDTELVAVITAAIMASMGEDAPKDGLFIRSIRRKSNKRNWQNI